MKRPVPPSLHHNDATGHGALIENVVHEEEREEHTSCTTCLSTVATVVYACICMYHAAYTRRVLDSRFRIREREEKEETRGSPVPRSLSECPQLSRPEGNLTSSDPLLPVPFLSSSPFECNHLCVVPFFVLAHFSFFFYLFYPTRTYFCSVHVSEDPVSFLVPPCYGVNPFPSVFRFLSSFYPLPRPFSSRHREPRA